MIDPSISTALIGGGFGLVTLFAVRWMKRSDDDRAVRLLAATAAAKVAADGAAALAEKNLLNSLETTAKLGVIEKKVDGTLSKAVTDLAAMNIAFTELSAAFTEFRGLAKQAVKHQEGSAAAEVKQALTIPIPVAASNGPGVSAAPASTSRSVMSTDYKK